MTSMVIAVSETASVRTIQTTSSAFGKDGPVSALPYNPVQNRAAVHAVGQQADEEGFRR
jgi:hypothetical protein